MAEKRTTKKTSKKIVTKKSVNEDQATPRPSKFFVGAMGDHFVMAELLARGFNVSRAVVHEGTDVVAFKADTPDKLYRIQVKTAFSSGGVKAKRFTFSLGTSAYEQAAGKNYFLVLVMRDDIKDDFTVAVIPSHMFDRYRRDGHVIDWNVKAIGLKIDLHLHTDGRLTIKNGTGKDITIQTKNRWDYIG